MPPVELPAWLSGLISIVVTGATVWWLQINEHKKRKGEPVAIESGHAQVVAATFTERALMEQLIVAISSLNGTVAKSIESTEQLVTLLEADVHRREVAAEVEKALRNMGANR